MIYDSLEQDVGIIAACSPAMTPLFRSKGSAKKSAHELEDKRPIHRHLNKWASPSLLALTTHTSAERHQAEIGPRSSIQTDEVGLKSLDGRGGTSETGLAKTVDISHEGTVSFVPATWFSVSHSQDDGTNLDQV